MAEDGPFPRFSLRTLGTLGLSVQARATAAETPVVLGEKSCALIVYLWLAEHPVPREMLCSLLWDGSRMSDARNNLRQAIFRVRRVLGSAAIQEDARGLWLSAPRLAVDLAPYVAAENGTARTLPAPSAPFAVMRQPMSSRFVAWRDGVRRRFGGHDGSTASDGAARAAGGTERRHPLGEVQALEALRNTWQMTLRGVALSLWLAAATGARRRDAVRAVRRTLREEGASITTVSALPRGARGEPSLWVSVAVALWSKPGAMGVAPKHVRLLEDVPGALSVDEAAARTAVLDLVRAVADERPLAIVVEDALAFGSASAEAVVRALTTLRGSPVLLVLLAPPTAAPVAPDCLVHNGFGEPTSPIAQSAPRASRRSER